MVLLALALLLPVDMAPLALTAFLGIASAGAAIRLSGIPAPVRTLVPFGAGILVGITGFGIWPELAGRLGGLSAAALLAVGVAILGIVNGYLYPVCPACSQTHDHEQCAVRLHGFAPPLVIAGVLHSFLDGWGVAASEMESSRLGATVFLAVALHKIPEGLAYGAILVSALGARWPALAWSAVAQLPTLAGGLAAAALHPGPGAAWMPFPLALAGGSFLFLGWHAFHSEWKRRGPLTAFGAALSGVAGAAALHHGFRVWLR
jgi:zinc transporter ZupT